MKLMPWVMSSTVKKFLKLQYWGSSPFGFHSYMWTTFRKPTLHSLRHAFSLRWMFHAPEILIYQNPFGFQPYVWTTFRKPTLYSLRHAFSLRCMLHTPEMLIYQHLCFKSSKETAQGNGENIRVWLTNLLHILFSVKLP